MIEYTIKAIPTTYNGRRYRSRLEAKWAAFFDLLQWAHEYEPFDLGAWSPDFLISAPAEGSKALVEIKPILTADRKTQRKMEISCRERNLMGAIDVLLLLGTNPTAEVGDCQIGWMGTFCENTDKWDWHEAFLMLLPPVIGVSRIDILVFPPHQENGSRSLEDGFRGAFSYHSLDMRDGQHAATSIAPIAMEMWKAASNLVQWLPKGRPE